MLLYFAMVIQESARLTLGKKGESLAIEGKGQVLTCHHVSSLVIDRLCDQAMGENVAVACFYFDFAAQKEQSSNRMLEALLKQVIGGLEEIPSEISETYGCQKRLDGGWEPQLSSITKVMQAASSERLTFICIDAMDECAPEQRIKILGSLDQILRKSPGARVFMTGRPHVQAEIEKCLSRRVASIAITRRKGDIIEYLRARLREDTKPGAMDITLEAEILRKIPEDVSEMCVEATTPRKLPQVIH